MRTVVFAVAGLAKYFAVRGVAARGAVQGPLALQAGEAALVEAEVPGQHAFRVEHFPVASKHPHVICNRIQLYILYRSTNTVYSKQKDKFSPPQKGGTCLLEDIKVYAEIYLRWVSS